MVLRRGNSSWEEETHTEPTNSSKARKRKLPATGEKGSSLRDPKKVR